MRPGAILVGLLSPLELQVGTETARPFEQVAEEAIAKMEISGDGSGGNLQGA